jgi:UDP-N-acetylmuramoylalanine--D-glutamate ligase
MKNWKKKTILIIGAARQGQALARYLSRKGATVILNDIQPANKFPMLPQQFNKDSVRCVFGSHPLNVLEKVDLVSLSGGVPLTNPLVVEAQKRGIPVTNDTQVFMEEVTAPVIGITGSAGKTTTTSLVGEMARMEAGPGRKAWVGGNIGFPLVDHLDEINPQDIVVLEISSFQLEQMTISPHIAAVLNITPNHLDRHKTLEAYTAAKERLLLYQKSRDLAILNREDAGAWALKKSVKGILLTFGQTFPARDQEGTFLHQGMICMQIRSQVQELLPVTDIRLRGDHSLMNVLAACAIGWAAGLAPESMKKAVQGFTGVAHRLEFVRSWHGADWYNDSIATAPERTLAAIRSFDQPIVLLLGGRDKDLPWQDLARLVCQKVEHVILFGESAEKIQAALDAAPHGGHPLTVERVPRLQDAVTAAARIATSGDVVLLSPGGTSFDEFKDFEERGERFREWVNHLS